MDKKQIFALKASEMKEDIAVLSMPSFRAKQIEEWLYKKHVWQFARMRNISAKDIMLLNDNFAIMPADITLLANQESQDKLTRKLLLSFHDKNTVETVGMRHDYGNSVCVSSQVGCAMGCTFCASGISGFVRNLSAPEMLSQAAFFQNEYAALQQRVDNIVIMGSGEPLLNYDEVIKFVHLLHDPLVYNISYRNITISTCGIISGIEKLKSENIPLNLALSLHAPDDELRSRLMPVNKKHGVKEVVNAAADYARHTGRQVTAEYILIKNLNDSQETAEKLARLLKNKLFSVNIIPANPVPEKGWQRPARESIKRFIDVLKKNGVNATLRKEMGTDISAACGQLRSNYNNRSV